MFFRKKKKQKEPEELYLVKIHSDVLNDTTLTKQAAAWALQNGFQVTSPDFTGRLCGLDPKAKIGAAVDTFGKYELYSWHTSQKYKPLTQKDIDISAQMVLESGFVEINPFEEFNEGFQLELDAEQTEFIDELLFIPVELLENRGSING